MHVSSKLTNEEMNVISSVNKTLDSYSRCPWFDPAFIRGDYAHGTLILDVPDSIPHLYAAIMPTALYPRCPSEST